MAIKLSAQPISTKLQLVSGTFLTVRRWAVMLFSTPFNACLTVLASILICYAAPPLMCWLVLDAVLFNPDPQACRDASGACWSFIRAKYSQLLFGIYPPDERWRPALSCLLIIGLLAWSVRPSSWRIALAYVWAGAMIIIFWLMGGGIGLVSVPTTLWGGLPITLILTVAAIGLGFPFGILLALGRRSSMPALRLVCVVFIESVRGLPLLSILFVASIMLPLFLPEMLLPDKFSRALVALMLFASAYFAEVVRGGLQAMPKGQYEAASSLALPYWKTQRLIIMPQAIKMVIPAITNTIIVMVKNTSLVMVVGLFDLVSSGKAALADPAWPSPSTETYLFIGAIFFIICFCFARFADFLERKGKASH